MRILIIALLMVVSLTTNAQQTLNAQSANNPHPTTPHRCNATEIHNQHYNSDADYRHDFDTRKVLLDAIRQTSNTQTRLACTNPIIIPVAVHYEGVTSQTAACLEQLALSQIAVLNEDYSASNTDITNFCNDVDNSSLDPNALAYNGACIQFCLANQNHPAGFGLNNGDYAITTNEDYVANNSFPNFTNGTWSGYLNIFVTEGTGVLGYAPLFGNANGDGVVIEACAFGLQGNGCSGGIGPGSGCAGYSDYNLGRTATHEVGHYLGLNHIWGDGGCGQDDGFADTPTAGGEYYGCPAQGTNSCGSDDMYMNYMDYVNDACMYMFSEQQATLMYNTASSLWTTSSSKCGSNPTYPVATLPSGCNPADNDAGVIAHINPVDGSSVCVVGTSITPTVTIQNFGVNTLTSVTIAYQVNGNTPVTQSWTGSLATNATEDVTLAAYNEPAGAYTFNSYTDNPNAVADDDTNNDSFTTNHQTVILGTIPYQEDFEDGTFDPTNSGLGTFNPDVDAYVWTQGNVSANGVGNYCAFFDNFSGDNSSNPGGTFDALTTPVFDFSTVTGAQLTFDVAYAQYDASFMDSLSVLVSTDCGETYDQNVYLNGGSGLATAPDITTAFTPTSTQWTNITVDLSAYNNNPSVSIAFANFSGWGNNMYIDNINITTSGSPNCAVTTTSTPTTCAGNDGTATATAINPVGTVTYQWSNGMGGATISNLGPGDYTVTIIDTGGCVSTSTTTVVDGCACGGFTATASVVSNPSCFGDCDGIATAQGAGGTGNVAYAWSNNFTQATQSNLCAGTYTITATDGAGCTAVTSVTIVDPPGIDITTGSTPETCLGNDGTAAVTSVGIAIYTYQWSNGMGGPSITGLVAGSYTITVTDINTNCFITETVVVGNSCNCDGSLGYQFQVTDAGCNNACIGTIVGTGFGGNPTYIYLWSDGTTAPGLAGLCAGDYTVTVTDAAQCTYVESITVPDSQNLVITTTSTPETCTGVDGTATATAGGNINFVWSTGLSGNSITGLIAGTYTVTATDPTTQCFVVETVTVSNTCGCDGSLGFSYQVTDADCGGVCSGNIIGNGIGGVGNYTYFWGNNETTSSITALCAGDYTVTVTDGINCTYTETITVGETASIVISTSSTPETCAGNDGTASATTGGGNIIFTWSNGMSTNTISNLVAGTYTVTATDVTTNCTATQTVLVGNDCGCDGSLGFSYQVTDADCGGVCSGNIIGNGIGGVGNYTYFWGNNETTSSITALCAGDYTVTVTDGINCTYTETITVGETASIVISTSSTPETCAGNDGTASATTGGGNIIFTWSNGMSTNTISNLVAGTYTVTATDVTTNCTATQTVLVGNDCGCDGSLSYQFTTQTAGCQGFCGGFINGTAVGGDGNYNYAWSSNETTSGITGLCVGDYTVTISDGNNCTYDVTISITEDAPITFNTNSTPESCTGNDGTATATGDPNLIFVWSTGMSGNTITGLASGIYTVTATDVVTQCTGTQTVVVEENCGCTFVITATSSDVSCPNECDGSASATSNGTNVIYIWSNGNQGSAVNNLCSGVYTVTATDGNNCTDTYTVVIEEPSPMSLLLSGNDASCGEETGSVTVNVIGGTAPFSYQWSTDDTNNFVSGLNGGSYFVTVTDANGCTADGSTTIVQIAGMNLNDVITTVSCFGESDGSVNVTVSGGTPPYTYNWDNGATSEDIANVPSGIYTLIVSDANNCSFGTSYNVSQPNELAVNMTVTGATSGSNGSAVAGTTGGTAPFTWNWSNGITGIVNNNLAPGDYIVIVTDANGCTVQATATIEDLTNTFDPSFVLDWSIHPNPSQGLFQFNMELAQQEGISIRIVNVIGQTVYASEYNGSSVSEVIDIRQLAQGTYFIEMTVKNSRVVEKLLIVK